MPALEALLSRFDVANTQPLGISVDSVFSHANWGRSLGGISFPLLADFHPKGAIGELYGAHLDDGRDDRATVIIDADGIVQYSVSVGPDGQRDLSELAHECEKVNSHYEGTLPGRGTPPGVEDNAMLFVKNNCGFSRAVLLARDNLHLEHSLETHNVSDEISALAELEKHTGAQQAPALVIGDKSIIDSKEIIAHLVSKSTSLV